MTTHHKQAIRGRSDTTLAAPSAPWWRYGWVWLVIAGPASVVLASIATVFIVLSHPEVVIAEDYYRRGLEINKQLAAAEHNKTLMPAMQGRNHAATPAAAAR